ncbi:MAG: hypothetical protein ABJQ70_14960 [Roseobacter sp.]
MPSVAFGDRIIGDGNPIYLMADLGLTNGGDLVVLHDFHTDVEAEMSFRAMDVYRQLGMVAGYTPQGRSDWLDDMSVSMDAAILGKRLTTSRKIPANGHCKAHELDEPDEFSEWGANIRRCETAKGNAVLTPMAKDQQDAKKYCKAAYLLRDVKNGELELNRPGTGLRSCIVSEQYIGWPYPRDFSANEMLEIG